MFDHNSGNESELNEPSVFEIYDTDRMKYTFSDVSVIGGSEIHFVARAVRGGQWFVIKGLKQNHREDAGAEAMLRKEFELLVSMQHPNIRRALSFEDRREFGPCIIMDYIEGPNLRNWLATPRPLKERVKIALEIADALSYIHNKGIVHRDIKPENIIVSRIGGRPVIIDFGLSDSDRFAVLKSPGGTPPYVSPEQETSSIPDPKNDIYSFGILLKELLPERCFARIVSNCIAPIGRRSDSANGIGRSIRSAHRQLKLIVPGVLFLAIVVTLAIIFLPASSRESTERQEGENISETLHGETVEPQENFPKAYTLPGEAPGFEGEKANEYPENTSVHVMKHTPESTPGSLQNNGITAKPDLPQNSTSKEVPLSHEKALNEILNLGYSTIDLCIAEEFEKLNDPDVDAALLPEKLDARKLKTIKDNYLRGIGINIRSGGSFLEKYPLKLEDIDFMDKKLNLHLQECQQKWKEIRTQKLSNH